MKVKDYFCILLTLFSFFSLKLADKHFALVISISWLINFPLWYQMVLIEIRPSKQENFLAEKKNLLFRLPCLHYVAHFCPQMSYTPPIKAIPSYSNFLRLHPVVPVFWELNFHHLPRDKTTLMTFKTEK